MLPKHGRQKIIKDVHKEKSNDEQFENTLAGRRTALVGNNPVKDMGREGHGRSDIPHATFMTLFNMSAEQKEE